MHGRIPLHLKVVAVLVLFVFLALAVSGFFVLKRVKQALYMARLNTVETLLDHLANASRIPLLGDDTLSLTSLVKEMTGGEEYLYCTILDSKDIIKAHSDPARTGTVFTSSEDPARTGVEGKGKVSTFTLRKGGKSLDFSLPVIFKEKTLGSVHIGVSLESLRNEIEREILPTLYIFLASGLGVILVGTGTAFLVSRRLTRPIDRLQLALQRTLKGHFGETIREIPKNEVGDLTMAFNEMSLRLQEGAGDRDRAICRIAPGPPDPSSAPGPEPFPSEISRRQVSILFAGVKGFRFYAETKTPEQVLKDLNEYFAVAIDCILANDGFIDKFIGDGIIGVFGSSPPRVDHTERAVRSAVAIQKALRDGSKNGNEIFPRVGIGISSGVVLSGNIGPSSKKEHTFLGESFKAAYALNVMADQGEIVISKEVYELIENLVSVEPLPPREKMDRTESWENFRLRYILDK